MEGRHEFYFQTGQLLTGEREWRLDQYVEYLFDEPSFYRNNWHEDAYPEEDEFHLAVGDDLLFSEE